MDPVTGTVAVTYEDTRYDPSRSRTVETVQISQDGGLSFSKSTYADVTLRAFDQTTQTFVDLGPIPANQSALGRPNPAGPGQGGLGDRQGLAIYDGRLYVAFATNLNGGSNTFRHTEIIAAPMTYQTGPRVIASTMGLVRSQTVVDSGGTVMTFNNQFAADGTPIVDGFVVTFDRPVDPTTFTTADIALTYRDPFTPGAQPGIRLPIDSVTPLNDSAAPNPTVAVLRNRGATTQFLVRFPGQSFVGSYSYTVGPNIRDLTRSTQATNYYYVPQSATNIPVPPVGDGGSGVAGQDRATSSLVISGVPASQTILDLDILVTIQHPNASDLVLRLIPPPGYLPNGDTSLTLTGTLSGANLTDTTFDEQALRAIGGGTGPYTGRFRTSTKAPLAVSGLDLLNGKSPNGTWTLRIDDNAMGNAGRLLSWGLKVTTTTRSADGTFVVATGPALSPSPDGGGVLSPGHLMDQNADGLGGQNPNALGVGPAGSVIVGLAPGDVYTAPMPNPTTPQVFNGVNINPPFDPTTLPLLISGPRVARSYVPGYTTPTADNLVTDRTVSGFNIVFDRDMDPNSLIVGNHVIRVATPYGTFAPGRPPAGRLDARPADRGQAQRRPE